MQTWVSVRKRVAGKARSAVLKPCSRPSRSERPAGRADRLRQVAAFSYKPEDKNLMEIWFLLLGGLVLLIVGGELLVRGAVQVATRLGVSPLVIG